MKKLLLALIIIGITPLSEGLFDFRPNSMGILRLNQPEAFFKSCEPSQVHTTWKFVGYLYKGQHLPPRDPAVSMLFRFTPHGRSDLYWSKPRAKTFCHRKASYIFQNCHLIEEVTWVNPKNGPGCSADPDMKLGKRTITPLDFDGEVLRLHLSLSGEPLIYLWEPYNEDFLFPEKAL